MRIEKRIGLALFWILLLLLGAGGLICYATAASSVRRSVDNALRGIAWSRAALIQSLVGGEIARVRRMAASPAVQSLLDPRGTAAGRGAALAAAQRETAAAAGGGSPVEEIRAMDRSGETVFLEETGPPGDEAPLEALFARATAVPAVSIAASGRMRELLIAVPVASAEDGRFLGVLAAAVDARALDEALENPVGLGRTGALSLASVDGRLLTRSTRPAAGPPPRARLSASAPLREIGWTLRAEVDAAEALGPVLALRRALVVVLVVVPALAALAGLAAGRRIARPIGELLEGLRLVAGGELDRRLDVGGSDEAALLAAAFNDMVAKVRGAHRLLDERVEERTRDLRQKTEELERSRKALIFMLDDMNELNEKLRELNAIKSDFTSMVSHELRTPLTAITEGITLVLDGTAGPIGGEQREFLGLAQKNVRRLARLIDNVLDLAKLEQGKLTYVMEEHDLREIVREVVDAERPVALDKGLALESSLPASPAVVLCDRDRIIQVLTNLVGNALKFTRRGRVGVGVEEGGGAATVRVADTGGGIRPEEMGRLFRKFEQLPRAGKREPGGTGLGLAISKGIVEHHGGRMWAESEPGRGSTFIFTLPSAGGTRPEGVTA